ncbi:unnamed protein product [Cochlearia groenlandica]
MDRINGLSDELLIKILSYVPTKIAVTTSILSKRWQFLWTWLPNIEYDDEDSDIIDMRKYLHSIDKNLLLHRSPIIESLHLSFYDGPSEAEYIKRWVGIAVSRRVRELSITHYSNSVVLPSSLYTSKSLVALKLEGCYVDVPRTVCLPCLKTLQLLRVTYLKEDSLRLLLSYCPVLEDLDIQVEDDNNVKALVVIVPSLQRLSLTIDSYCSCDDGYVIATPSLKYFKVVDIRVNDISYLIKHMPKLEEARIFVDKDVRELVEAVTCVKRLSLTLHFINGELCKYRAGIVFDQLEHLEINSLGDDNWSKLVIRLLKDSPKLRVLKLYVRNEGFDDYKRIKWSSEPSSVPKCLLESLETLEFEGYQGRREERDFLSFIFKHGRCLKSPSISSVSVNAQLPQFPFPFELSHGMQGMSEITTKCLATLMNVPRCLAKIVQTIMTGKFGNIGPACCNAFLEAEAKCIPKLPYVQSVFPSYAKTTMFTDC